MSDIKIELEKNDQVKNTFRTLNVFDYVLHMPSINQMIFDFLKLKEQLQYKLLNKVFNLLDIKFISINRNQMSDNILLQYPKCEKVQFFYKYSEITCINHMKNLSELRLESFIQSIQLRYNITILKICGNKNITNINHLTQLVELDASHECKLTNEGIKGLISLRKLIINYNRTLTNLNHLNNLIELKASDNHALADSSIKGLINLQKLYLSYCINISNINHLKNLIVLDASGYNCGINDDGIKDLENLIILNASDNNNITCVNHLQKLEKLDASGLCGIDENGLIKLLKLKSLNYFSNKKITNFNNIPYIR